MAATAAVLLAICLVFMMPVSAEWTEDTSWGSNYDSRTEFIIEDAGDLAQFAVMVNAVDAGKDFSGKTVQLTADINLENQEWTPIGTLDNEFKGTFDGNGKTISGLKITQVTTDGYAGLFGTNSGTVTNLAVSGDITVTSEMVTAGGIVGDNYGSISKCYSEVDITVTAPTAYIGGIAGGSNNAITNCYSTGDISITSSTSGNQDLALGGGIVGSSTGSVSYCYAAGNVTASATTASAGGIAGLSKEDESSISNCYALNQKVTATGTASSANRIAAATTGLTGNAGWIGMMVNNKVVTTGTEADSNGKSSYAVQFWNTLDFFTGFDTNTWEIQSNMLPVLKGHSTTPDENAVAHLKPEFTFTYNSNGGAGTVSADYSKYAKGEPDTVKSPTSLTKENHNVADWNTKAEGTGASYVQGQEISITETVTLYANWTTNQVESYTVTFMSEGQTVHTDTVVSGGYVTEYSAVTRTGYTLDGWINGNSAWNFASNTVTSDTTLTANWKINQYTISFTNTGVSQVSPIKQDYGTPVIPPANPNWGDSYVFLGWEPQIPTTMPANDMTISGKWQVNQFTITFENTGDTQIESITQDYLTDITIVLENPVWAGYKFAGWDKNLPKKMPNWNTIITAQWTPNNYTVKYHANGGTGTMADQEFEYGVTEALNTSTFTAPSGKVFNGWNTKADGSGTYYPAGYSASKITAEDNAEVTLYAQWKYPSSGSSSSKPTYTVTFNANGGVGEMYAQKFTSGKEKALTLNFFTKEGYTFAGWATSADGAVVYTDGETIKVTKSMTLYAVWNADTPDVPETPDTPVVPDTPTTPDKPEQPTEPETPAPILAVLAGLGAAAVLRRK